ncbi:hypothetical protein BGZ76_002917 [Entomortierella beljakovae]|nr:hypothetical protein BGZ76_002917 [Entomortierella beljakovae]
MTDVHSSGGSDSDRNSGQQYPPDRPDRPDRRMTQRPAPYERQNSSSNLALSQSTSQLINPQLGQRPLTTLGAPPPRTASAGAGFQNSNNPSVSDYQSEGLSVATRRQTLRDDFQGGYGGAVIGTASPMTGPNSNRRTMTQLPANPSPAGPSPSPLRVINVSPSSPPQSSRPLPEDSETIPIRSNERRNTNFVPPPPGSKVHTFNNNSDEANPYAMEAISTNVSAVTSPATASPSTPISSGYVPPPPSSNGQSNTASSPANSSVARPPHPSSSPSIQSPGTFPGMEKKLNQMPPPPPPPPQSLQASTPIPGPLDRSTSPAPGRFPSRGSGGSSTFGLGIGPAPSSPIPSTDPSVRSSQDVNKIKALESKAVATLDENASLKKELKEKQQELEKMRKRENWLVVEVIMARDSLATPVKKEVKGPSSSSNRQSKRMSIIDLERELESGELDGQDLKVTKALLRVKEELRSAKMSIATQAQVASSKVKEAERIRTGALQEAAYLKAKLSSLANAHQDPDGLANVEIERALDLEKRLTSALSELESMESKYTKTQEALEQEKVLRVSAEERSQSSTSLAEQAQSAHTRARSELATLHNRATKAEADSRDYAAQLAETQAGFTGHQSQSSGLLQKIKTLKQQVEDHEKALEKTQLAFSAANERAVRAEIRAEESSSKIEKLENQRYELSSEANRYRDEAERLHSKIGELENRWQVSKDEVNTLRKLVEDGLGSFSPRMKAEKGSERKHDSIAILSTVSKVSELEHELGSLKKLLNLSQGSASKSSAELAEAMIEVSHLEQSSMQARAEVISLQKALSHEREGVSELRGELNRTQQELETKAKELEDNEVQLGLLKDVMREKGIIAEDVVIQARERGTPAYAASMEEKVRDAEERIYTLQMEIEESRARNGQQMEKLEGQRQATLQHAEKTALLLRKIKDDLGATMKEKSLIEAELRKVNEEHSSCKEIAQRQFSQKEQEEERVSMLTMHWNEERREITGQLDILQSKLVESEMHSAELSQKVISLTERLQEVEQLNETIADELEALQDESKESKDRFIKQEVQLQSDVERLISEIHQVQEKLHSKQVELDEAYELNEQLEEKLRRSLMAQDATLASKLEKNSESLLKVEEQRQELERRLKKSQETIQALEGDNSVLEARLADSEKKVTLLLASNASNPTSPLNSADLAGVHQQLADHLNGDNDSVSNSTTISSLNLNSSTASSNNRLLDTIRSVSNNNNNKSSSAAGSISPHSSNIRHNSNTATLSSNSQNQSYGSHQLHNDEEDEYDYNHQSGEYYQGQDHGSNQRDSVDSITRELEMLKVPWNKNTTAFNASSSLYTSQQSTQQQTYQYSSKFNDQQNQFYDYEDESSDEGNEEEYLEHLRQQQKQQEQQVKQQQQHNNIDTHSFNDRSPSRLKEYEQMIDEIENSRLR